MTVRVYYDDDASAPVLTGLAGSLISVLDACLVNGYGSKGAAGWTKEFSAANQAVYRAPSGLRHYFRVDDTSGQEARIRGYETMSGISAGTGPFPTDAQVNGGLYLRKSNAASSATRGWCVTASDTGVFILPNSAQTSWVSAYGVEGNQAYFGEFDSRVAGDNYNTCIIGAVGSGIYQNRMNSMTPSGCYSPRSYLQTGTSWGNHRVAELDPSIAPITYFGPSSSSTYTPFPDPISGDLNLTRIMIVEDVGAGRVIRGYLRGVWGHHHVAMGNHGDTFNGSGTTSGKTFMLFDSPYSSSTGRIIYEISNTW